MDERYSRQTRFESIGKDGQRRIQQKHALLVGCGALGTHLADMLVRAGIRQLTIVDRDVTEPSNLQRQTLFTESDVEQGLPKAVAAKRHLQKINSNVDIQSIVCDYHCENAADLAQGVDLILDATDNFETRFLINDVSVKLNIPWIYAACVSAQAMCMPILPGDTACLTCMLESLPGAGGETCDTAGIIMPAVMQAVSASGAEALKILSDRTLDVITKLQIFDCWKGTKQHLDASRKREGCETCARGEFPYLSGSRAAKATKLCGRNTVQISPASSLSIGFDDIERRVSGLAHIIVRNQHLLKLGARSRELTLFTDGRALVSGTDNIAEAKALYAQLIGN